MSGGYNRLRDQALEGLTSIGRGFNKYRQYQAAILAGLAGTAAGTYDGWVMAAINLLNMEKSHILVYLYITNASAMIGALIAGYLVATIGRKQALIMIGAIMLPVWVLFSFPTVWTISMGSALGGLAAGGASVAVPVYIAELAEDSIRGTLGTFFYLQFISGEMITMFGIKHRSLPTTSAFAVLIAVIFLLTFIWMPESSYFLAANGKQLEAEKSIEFFRGPSEHIEEEITRLREASSKAVHIKHIWKDLSVRKPLLISLGLMFLSRLLALDGFNFRLYKAFLHTSENHIVLLFGVILGFQVVGIFGAAFFIETLGRKWLLFISIIGMSVCILILIIQIYISYHFWIAFFTLCSYIAMYSVGLGPVPWVMSGELLPVQYKVVSYTLTAALFWLMALLSNLRMRLLFWVLGHVGTIGIYLVLCIITLVYTELIVPETKGQYSDSIVNHINTNIFQRDNQQQAAAPV